MECENGVEWRFTAEILNLIEQNKNDQFVRALADYRQSQSRWTVNHMIDSTKATLLHYAAEYGNGFIVKYLINCNCAIDVQDKFGRSPLMLAVMGNHEMVVKILLKAKANIHLTDYQGKSTLQMILELRTDSPRMIKILLHYVTLAKILLGITPSELAKNLCEVGFTLPQAVRLKNPDLIKLLLDQVCYAIDQKDTENEETALHTAVKNKHLEIVKMLVDHGSDVDALDSIKAIPVYYLYKNNENIDVKNSLEILKILVKCSTLLTTSNDHLRMQIYNVLINGCKEAVQIVLECISDLNVFDQVGNTVVHYLARNTNEDVMEALRDRDFNVNVPNQDTYTPLHIAAAMISLPNIKFLLEHKADVHIRGHSYDIPLYTLFLKFKSLKPPEHKDVKKCIELLLEYGSDAEDYDVIENFEWITKSYKKMQQEENDRAGDISTLVEPLLKYLAINKISNGNVIDEFIMSKINLQPCWVKYFDDTCVRESERMSKTKIYENVTLYNFLTDNMKKIATYVMNEKLLLELKKFIDRLESSSPYSILLRKRLAKASRLVNLRNIATAEVNRLINVNNNLEFDIIAQNIVEYLTTEDIKNVCFALKEKNSSYY